MDVIIARDSARDRGVRKVVEEEKAGAKVDKARIESNPTEVACTLRADCGRIVESDVALSGQDHTRTSTKVISGNAATYIEDLLTKSAQNRAIARRKGAINIDQNALPNIDRNCSICIVGMGDSHIASGIEGSAFGHKQLLITIEIQCDVTVERVEDETSANVPAVQPNRGTSEGHIVTACHAVSERVHLR